VALKPCSECGHSVSRSAHNCPSCGHPLRTPRKWLGWVVVALGLPAGVLIAESIISRAEQAQESESVDSTQQSTRQSVEQPRLREPRSLEQSMIDFRLELSHFNDAIKLEHDVNLCNQARYVGNGTVEVMATYLWTDASPEKRTDWANTVAELWRRANDVDRVVYVRAINYKRESVAEGSNSDRVDLRIPGP